MMKILLGLLLVIELAAGAAKYEATFLAQKHVQEVNDARLKLVGELPVLLKIHVSGTPMTIPTAVVTLGSTSSTLTLAKPGCAAGATTCTGTALPTSFPSGLGVVTHGATDPSFKAIIAANFVKTGMKLKITLGGVTVVDKVILVGAPTVLNMIMFDMQFFGGTGSSFTDNDAWRQEYEGKTPVKALNIQRVRNLNLQSLVIFPRSPIPATLVHSKQQYKALTGFDFDGEQGSSGGWTRALQSAGGQSRLSLTFGVIFGVGAGGQAGDFSGVGNANSAAINLHELGHALGCPHWGDNTAYPYKGAMYNIQPPDNYKQTHAGPNWAYYARNGYFIPSRVQANNVGKKTVGTYKADPMQGGANGWQETPYMMGHFSDYSSWTMQNYLESKVAVKSGTGYFTWDQTAGTYSKPLTSGIPTSNGLSVRSIFVTIGPKVNWVYPDVGPYISGLITLYDPTSSTSRAAAVTAKVSGDFTLKIKQGSLTKHILVPVAASTPYMVIAFNVPASDGTIDRIDLLQTPAAQTNGVPASAFILASHRGDFMLGDANNAGCPSGFVTISTAAECSGASFKIQNVPYNAAKNVPSGGVCTFCGGIDKPDAFLAATSDTTCTLPRRVCKRSGVVVAPTAPTSRPTPQPTVARPVINGYCPVFDAAGKAMVAQSEGSTVGTSSGYVNANCEQTCNGLSTCYSFAKCTSSTGYTCWMKTGKGGSSAYGYKTGCQTYYKTSCNLVAGAFVEDPNQPAQELDPSEDGDNERGDPGQLGPGVEHPTPASEGGPDIGSASKAALQGFAVTLLCIFLLS